MSAIGIIALILIGVGLTLFVDGVMRLSAVWRTRR
jgi:hypothetical protein